MRPLLALLILLASAPVARAADGVHWQPWSEGVFAEAKAQHKFVLLDLEAVWCHWCHVMDQQTYADPKVAGLMGKAYIAVKVDQDSDPELSNRYGDYGWPATIVFAADGSEIVKRQGYLAPQQMAGLLQAIIDDPSPGPSVHPETPVQAAAKSALGSRQRTALVDAYLKGYDAKYGGWGDVDKFVDADPMDYALRHVDAEPYRHMAAQTLDAGRSLIDPVWGGVDQYSASVDWETPHFEKLLQVQAVDLRLYAEAYGALHTPACLDAARRIHAYMDAFLKSPQGGYYVSQDADLSAAVPGGDYYKLDDAARRKLGIPHVDTHVYARENGWAIRALAAYSDATGDGIALDEAKTAALLMLQTQTLPGGGFRHADHAEGGPYLGDSLAMAEGLLDVYRSTGNRAWLLHAIQALDFIEIHFRDAKRGGYITAPAVPGAAGVLQVVVRLPGENADLVRTASLAYAYSAEPRYRRMAEYAMRYLAAPALSGGGRFMPGVLLAESELVATPLHITVVGHKDDASAQALHAAALAYPADFKQVDWWDKREGPLPDPAVSYPELPKAAAFICTGNTCSSPIFDPARIAPTVARLSAPAS